MIVVLRRVHFITILSIILFCNNLNGQCALKYDQDEIFTSFPTDQKIRKIDRSIIRTAAKYFEIKSNSVKAFYFEDSEFKNAANGRAYAISTNKANRLIKDKFGKAKIGYVKIGYNFANNYLVIADTIKKGRFRVNVITNFVYAHEIAHLIQVSAKKEDRWNWADRKKFPQKLLELNADFAAGLYMGGAYLSKTNEKIFYNQDPERAKADYREKVKRAVSRYVYSIGDYKTKDYFNHHGTPKERVINFVIGLDMGIKISTSTKYIPMKQYMFLRWKDLKKEYLENKADIKL